MTHLHVKLTCKDTETAKALEKALGEEYAADTFGLVSREDKVYLSTVLTDESWDQITKNFTKQHPGPIAMRAYASFIDGVQKIYKSTFINGTEIEEEGEVYSILDEEESADDSGNE